jgi:hypothetical protein
VRRKGITLDQAAVGLCQTRQNRPTRHWETELANHSLRARIDCLYPRHGRLSAQGEHTGAASHADIKVASPADGVSRLNHWGWIGGVRMLTHRLKLVNCNFRPDVLGLRAQYTGTLGPNSFQLLEWLKEAL